MLPENRRQQLDGIVNQMVTNGESDDDIQFVVNDFKTKYSAADTPTPKPQEPGFLSDVATVGAQRLSNISNPKDSRLRKIPIVGPSILGPASNVAGQALNFLAGDLLIAALKAVTPKTVQKELGQLVKEQAGHPAVDFVKMAWNANPEDIKNDYENLMGISMIGPQGAFLKGAARGTAAVGREGFNIARDVGTLTNAGQKLTKAKNFVIGKPSEEQALKQILQTRGKTPDIIEKQTAAGRETLSKIDTKGVKNYTQLRENIDNAITEYARKVDDELLRDSTKYTIDDLATVEKTVKGTPVKSNYVETAIDQLDELYTKTGDNLSAAEIGDFKNKALTEGLTKKEVNDLARKYGMEFKAFNPTTGAPPTSVTKEMYENIRSGLKEVARRGLSDTAKELDSTISKFYTTRQLIDKNVEAANRLYQKVDPRGLGEKAGRALWTAIDLATLGTAKGALLKFIPRGMGYKVKNFIDLDEALARNLKILNNAEKQAVTRPEMRSSTGKAILGELSGMENVLQREGMQAPYAIRPDIGKLRPAGVNQPVPPGTELGPVRSGRTVGQPYGPAAPTLIQRKQLPAGQGFELNGPAYAPDVIDANFTSSSRPIPQTPRIVAPETIQGQLRLPAGQGFELVDQPALVTPKIGKLIEQPKQDVFGSGLRAARERQAAQAVAKEKEAENLVTRIRQMGGITAGKDYNARILRQNPDAKRVLRNTGGKAPDAIAYQLQAEGWPVSSGDELIELLKSGKGRTIYNPNKAEQLFNRDIRRAENVWIEEQLAKNESIPREVRERIPDHQARVTDEIGSQGIVEERNLDQALKETSDFFEEMGGKVKAQTDNVKETSKPAKLGKLQP